MKIMVIGHARHGKDTVCNIITKYYGLRFDSSSLFVGEKIVHPFLASRGIVYDTMDACYTDRVNHRAAWHEAIAAYNATDPAKLGRELFAELDIYCGLRSAKEFMALKAEKAFQVCFWVDRSQHVGPEDFSSNKLSVVHADFIIDNNGSEQDLEVNVLEAMDRAMDEGMIPAQEPNFSLS